METGIMPIQATKAEEVERIVREHLAAFERGNFDAWGTAFAPDVFFTTAGPQEVFLTAEAAVAQMHKDFDPAFDEGLHMEVQPESFHVGLDWQGKVAWSAARLCYSIDFQEETGSFVLRHTSVLKKLDFGWSILATHYSLTLPEQKILQALRTGRLPVPAIIGDAVKPGARSLVEAFKGQLNDLVTAPFSPDVFVLGPFPSLQTTFYDRKRKRMNTSFERFAAWNAILAGISGFLYSISFIVLQNNLLSALFLLLGGLFSSAALTGLYQRVREMESGFALFGFLLVLSAALGSAIHGGYDLANTLHPPSSPNMDLPNSIDPRGLLSFGLAGLGLFTLSWLVGQDLSFPRGLAYLGYISAILMVVLYLGRLVILQATNLAIVIPALLEGFLVNPLWYLWLGRVLMRDSKETLGVFSAQ